jgi:hypothetical protein
MGGAGPRGSRARAVRAPHSLDEPDACQTDERRGARQSRPARGHVASRARPGADAVLRRRLVHGRRGGLGVRDARVRRLHATAGSTGLPRSWRSLGGACCACLGNRAAWPRAGDSDDAHHRRARPRRTAPVGSSGGRRACLPARHRPPRPPAQGGAHGRPHGARQAPSRHRSRRARDEARHLGAGDALGERCPWRRRLRRAAVEFLRAGQGSA